MIGGPGPWWITDMEYFDEATERRQVDADFAYEDARAEGAAAERERIEACFTPTMIEAIHAAWHGAGGNWTRFVGMLPKRDKNG